MRLNFLPHARERMEQRGISEEEVRATLEAPDREYFGNRGRTVAERTLPGRGLATKVVYDISFEHEQSWVYERIVVTVELGRPSRGGGER